jgi:hypothetical protein
MTCALLAANLLLGGATRAGYFSDAALQIFAVPLLVALIINAHALVE